MAQDVVVNGTTYPDVETVVMTDKGGNAIPFYPDAVRYSAQTLTEAQKAQARQNIGVPEAINGERGTGILKVTTAPSGYTTAIGSYTPKYRIALSTVTSQSKVSKVLLGDVIQYSYYQYHVDYLDSTYAYISATRTSLRGAAGTTPVRGTDYWTEADQEAIVQQVITALGTPVFGTVDANNNIILTGALADGTYTIKYEDAEGNQTTIGTLIAEGAPAYTNILPLAINSDGTRYNGGKGWKPNTRLNSSGTETTVNGIEATGFMAVSISDTIYFANVLWQNTNANADKYYIAIYDSSFTKLASLNMSNLKSVSASAGVTYDENGNAISLNMSKFAGYYGKTGIAYLRISAEEITDASIITKNEPIE
jgi:hypothetical protein